MNTEKYTNKELLQKYIAVKSEPEWLIDLRGNALRISGFPALPPRDTESWRKLTLDGFEFDDYNLLDFATEIEIENPPSINICDAIKNQEHSKIIMEMTNNRLNKSAKNNPFDALTLALYENGTFIEFNKDQSLPAYVRHFIGSDDSLFHRNIIRVAPSVTATVVEEFHGKASSSFRLWSNVTDAVVEENARLNYIALGYFTDCEFFFNSFEVNLKKNARVHVSVINLGGHRGKCFYTARLKEEGSEYRAIGITAGANNGFCDMEMLADHHAGNSQSSLLYKAVLGGGARSVFNGNLYIEKNLKNVSSRQMNNNILIGENARAESIPNLITRAEEVSCDHGATVGELDPGAIFYLMSRGISEEEARKLLIEGFITEVVSEIPLAEKHEEIMMAVKNRISL